VGSIQTLAGRLAGSALVVGLAWFTIGAVRPQAQAVQAATSSCNLTAPGRIVAVGDVHGAFDQYVTILREAQLIDNRRRWTGGNATFVQLGDVLDRGPQSRQALDLIRRLETEAKAAGGQVVFLLGNHEVMRMAGDLRYVSPAEYEAFKSPDASMLRDRLFDHLVTQNTAAAKTRGIEFDAKDFRKEFYRDTPLGSVEMQIAFSESGEYGSWLRAHDIMARVNGIAFVHGGPGPVQAAVGCDGTNAQARKDIKTYTVSTPKVLDSFLWNADGALWYRGLVTEPEAGGATPDDVTAVLKALGATRIVVGHTVTAGRIRTWFDNRVFQIDTGMLNGEFYPGGAPAALEVQNGTFTAIYPGKREILVPASPR
jgi:hypothetical protein